jgi:outer membrane protein OmpA-like peptidoglycan-associated protein
MKRIIPFLVILFYTAPYLVGELSAQDYHAENKFYLQGHVGAVSYIGDLNDINEDESYFSVGFNGGMGYYFSPKIALGLDYRLGKYAHTRRPSFPDFLRRHTANLYLMYNTSPSSIISPYIMVGAGMTMWGTYDWDPEFEPAFGPFIGLGLEIALGKRVSFLLEGKSDFVLDDEAMDEISGDRGFDMLHFYSVGLRLYLGSTFRPVTTFSLSGPPQLFVDEEGEFSVSLIDQPTEPIEYMWNFGDGTTKFGQNVSYSYTQPGNYTVTVSVSNARSSQERQMSVRVRQRPEPARIAALRADNTQPDVGQPVRFIADITGTEPVSVSWNFGDGTTSEQKLAQHSYSEPGEYTVTLTVDNTAVAGEGARETRTLRIRVQEPEVEIPALRTVHFALNSSYFDDETRQILRENIQIMQENPTLCVVVRGYTDGTGADRYNQWLSERRAERVKDFYVENGIMAERIHFTGEGLAPEPCPADATGCRENRRVETELVECE